MARPHGNPDDLIQRIEAALKVAKPADVVGANEMSAILKMSWRNLLLTHIEPDNRFPIQRRGMEGMAWEFRVVKVLKHMLKRANERKAANEAKARRLMELTGFTVPENAEAMNIAEIAKLIDVNAKARAEKVEQGKLLSVDETLTFLTGYNRTVCAAILNAGQHLDPTGSLPPEISEALKDYLRDHAMNVHQAASDYLEKWRAAAKPGGIA